MKILGINKVRNLDHFIGVECTIKTFNEKPEAKKPVWHRSPIRIIGFMDNHVVGDNDQVVYEYLDDSYCYKGRQGTDNRETFFDAAEFDLIL